MLLPLCCRNYEELGGGEFLHLLPLYFSAWFMKSSEVQSTKLNVQCQSHMRLCICSEQEANLAEHDATEKNKPFFF